MMVYSQEFKESVIEKVLTTGRPQQEVAEEVGVGRSTLQYWLRKYQKNGAKNLSEKEKRPQDWTSEQRFASVVETEGMTDEQIGCWCRKHGLHTHHLNQWKTNAISGCSPGQAGRNNNKESRLKKRIKTLEKELRRKEKALAETAALLVLRKKANAIWGDGEDD
jgi:transposase-like protein